MDSSIHNRADCFDIKVFDTSIKNVRQKLENFNISREKDEIEVIQEILNDLEANLQILELIGKTGEKLVSIITNKLDGKEHIKTCADAVSEIKKEVYQRLQSIEFLSPDMRTCTNDQLNNLELVETYLVSVYQGLDDMGIAVFYDEVLFERIRSHLTYCSEISFLDHPVFRDKVYAPDLEAIKSQLELIRAGVEYLQQLLSRGGLIFDETGIRAYEACGMMNFWLPDNMLQMFENMVHVADLHGDVMGASKAVCEQIINESPIDLTNYKDKLQENLDIFTMLEEQKEFLKDLASIDRDKILKGKFEYIKCQFRLLEVFGETIRISQQLEHLKDKQKQSEIVSHRQSMRTIKGHSQEGTRPAVNSLPRESIGRRARADEL